MLRKYQLLRDSGLAVFDRRTIANILDLAYASTNPVLDRLVRKGVLVRLRRDRYVLPERMGEASRKIANELVKPSCISLWTALSDAGLTTQVPREVQSVTPKRSTVIEKSGLPSFRYVHLPEHLFFGFAPDRERVFRAEPEKALLDVLYYQRGHIDAESIRWKELRQDHLRTLANRFPRRVQQALRALLQDNPCYTDRMIHEQDVMAVVRKIVEGVHPEKVIAFGSWAEGRAGRDSDLDILVIMSLKPGEKRFMKSGEIRGLIRHSPFPMDILVRSPEDIERRLAVGDYFIRDILEHGRILHSS